MDTCVRCGVDFDPVRALGQWGCRMHASVPYNSAHGNSSVYACCGMRLDRILNTALLSYPLLSELSTNGCVHVDHQGQNDNTHIASDRMLFADHHKERVAPYVPKERLVPIKNTEETDDMRDEDDFGFTLASVRRQGDLLVNVTVAGGAPVNKNISPVLASLITEAYSDPEFVHKAKDRRGHLVYDEVLPLQMEPDGQIDFPEN